MAGIIKISDPVYSFDEVMGDIPDRFPVVTGVKREAFVHGTEKRKSTEQKLYEKVEECLKKLKKYSEHIRNCGDKRGTYSRTDHDASFFRMKKDYMGNDQLLPGYNLVRVNEELRQFHEEVPGSCCSR